MQEIKVKKSWVEEAIDWYSTPKDLREPKTAREFCIKRGISESTFYYENSKKDFQAQILKKSLLLAKKSVAGVLEKLGEKAENGDNRAIELYLKYVLRLGDKTSEDRYSNDPIKVVTVRSEDEIKRLERLRKELKEAGCPVTKDGDIQ